MNVQCGWIFALKVVSTSNWGSVEGFYKDVITPGDSKTFLIDSGVWGRVFGGPIPPGPGDGIAFYHTSRAKFPRPDPGHGRPRISLIGKLQAIHTDGRELRSMRVKVDRQVAECLMKDPILSVSPFTRFLERCGIGPGPVAALYWADMASWGAILSELDKRMRPAPKATPVAPPTRSGARS